MVQTSCFSRRNVTHSQYYHVLCMRLLSQPENRMKSSYSTTSPATLTSLPPIGSWFHSFEQLLDRLRPHFARPEPFQHARQYLQAVLSDIPRKNGWQIAEQAQQAHPYGIQRLLSQAVWDEDAVRDEVRDLVCSSLQPPAQHPLFPVLVLDESGCPKRGRHSAGVAPQYCGLTGRVENCQMGVFLSCVTALGHGLIDRELYLPEAWCQDQARRQAAHIPETVTFQTKPELARQMLERTLAAGLRPCWVVADTVYGHSTDLRLFLEDHARPYALAVASTEVVCAWTPAGPRLADVATLAHDLLAPQDWHRLSASLGTKGERLFDWARLPLLHHGTHDHRHWLVVRRCLEDPHQLAYYLVFALLDTPLYLMVQAIGARWHIEEDLQHSKGLGLDHGEVRRYRGWYRHLTLVLLAAAFLLHLTVPEATRTPPPPPEAESEEVVPSSPTLIPLTRQEVRHVLARLLWPLPCSVSVVGPWSGWRRRHQAQAQAAHRRQRSRASPSPTLPTSPSQA